jgi:preprotein translocase subunit SecE
MEDFKQELFVILASFLFYCVDYAIQDLSKG